MTFNLSSQNFTATLIMRIRSFLAFVISICITFASVPVKTFAFSERGNAQFTDVVNTGKANDCPTLDSSLVGQYLSEMEIALKEYACIQQKFM